MAEEGIGSVAQESGEGRLDLAAGAQPAPRARPTPARLGPSRVQPACDHLIAYVRAAFDNRWRRFQNRFILGRFVIGRTRAASRRPTSPLRSIASSRRLIDMA